MSEVTVKQRDKSIDIAKGIGIILVVYGHLACPIKEEIYLFHMPLFFLLSGYFFSIKDSLRDFLVKKTKALLLPAILFYILSFLYSFILSGKDSILYYFHSLGYFLEPNGVIWFLVALYYIFLICYVTEKYIRLNLLKYGIVLIITILGYWLAEKKIFFLYISQAFIGYIFFYLGYQIKRFDFFHNKRAYHYMILIAIIGYSIGVIFHVSTDIALLEISPSYVLFLFPALAGILLTIYLSQYLSHKSGTDWLAYLGKQSLLVMCVHAPLVSFAYSVVDHLTHMIYPSVILGSYIYGLLTLIILVPLSLYVGLLIKRIFPFCFAKR